jgi:hypothetical protein
MNNINKLQSDRLKHFPNVSSLLKISLGLVLFTIVSTALVYAETISVDIDGTSYNVDYTATGMTLTGIEADEFGLLLLFVDVIDTPASLEIILDRNFYDFTFDGLDDDFIILVDGDEPTFTETETTSQSRTLSIDLPAGTEEIEIIGSSFGESASIAEEETPVEEPIEETPVEEPVVEDKPVVTTPKVQCGPGTVLKDGACVLDERCGPGTILKDGACVLDSASIPPVKVPAETSVKGMGKETIVAFVAAFVIAGTVGVILALISKASKSSN